jgi:hypothetical protein
LHEFLDGSRRLLVVAAGQFLDAVIVAPFGQVPALELGFARTPRPQPAGFLKFTDIELED